jgi:hypothetical protein
MNFAEIQTAVQANPALLNEIANGLGKDIIPVIGANEELVKGIVPVLGQKGFIVRSQADEQSYLDTQKKAWSNEIIPGRDNEIYTSIENLIFELTQDKKLSNEKASDYLKRKFNDVKNSKIGDPVLKEQLLTLQSQLSEKDTTHKNEIKTLEDKYFTKELDSLFSSDLNLVNIAIPAHLKTDEEKQQFITSQKSMIKRDAMQSLTAERDSEGNIIFKDETGKQLISTKDGKPLKPIDIITNKYAFYLAKDEGRKQGGSGSGSGSGSTGTYTSKEQVYEAVKAQGLEPLTKAFSDEYSKLLKENKLS